MSLEGKLKNKVLTDWLLYSNDKAKAFGKDITCEEIMWEDPQEHSLLCYVPQVHPWGRALNLRLVHGLRAFFCFRISRQWSLGGGTGCFWVWMCYLWPRQVTILCLSLLVKRPSQQLDSSSLPLPLEAALSLSSESRSNLIQEEARVGCAWIAHPVTSSWATSTPCLPILTDRSGSLASVRFLLLDFSAEAVSWKIGQGLPSSASLAQLLHRSSIQPRSFSSERRGLLYSCLKIWHGFQVSYFFVVWTSWILGCWPVLLFWPLRKWSEETIWPSTQTCTPIASPSCHRAPRNLGCCANCWLWVQLENGFLSHQQSEAGL